MKRYRFRDNVTMVASSPSSADLEFMQLAASRGYELLEVKQFDPNTGQFGDIQYCFVTNDKKVACSSNHTLILPDYSLQQLTEKQAFVLPTSLFESVAEQLDGVENDIIQDSESFVPESMITDEQYRDGAIRACIFMEHGVKDGSTPVKAENVPGDKGGLTKYGITQAQYPNLDIANLTYEDAVKIYARDYWPDAKADELPRPLNALAFDLCVTSGRKNMMRVLQRAVGTTDDGIWGPKTKQAAIDGCSTTPKMLAVTRLFTEKRIDFYRAIVTNNSSQAKFLNGWINRAVRSQNFAQGLLHTLNIL